MAGWFGLRQHRIIPALRLKHRSGGSPRQEPPQTAVALRSASLRLGVRHGICVAKMLDNTQSIICAFGLAAAAPRSPYRYLELCGIALIKTTGTLQCTAVFLLFFMPKFIAHGGVSLCIITCVLTRVMNGAILSKLELQKKPRKPHENG